MGARQSKRSVDITTTPKKDALKDAEVSPSADATAPGEGKLDKIEENDTTKPTTNGNLHTESPEKDKDEATEKDVTNEKKAEEAKSEETKTAEATETAEVTTPTEATPAEPKSTASTPDTKEAKKKEKSKRKWSIRSISFSRKDKSKPSREAPKNGDVSKDAVVEATEEAGAAAKAVTPTEAPVAASESVSPTSEPEVVADAEEKTPEAPTAEASPEEKPASPEETPVPAKVEETPAPVPAPVSEPEENPVAVKEAVAVSAVATEQEKPVEVSANLLKTEPEDKINSKSIEISEAINTNSALSCPPSSPPPTPVEPSPLREAQELAKTASTVNALAEALVEAQEEADEENNKIKAEEEEEVVIEEAPVSLEEPIEELELQPEVIEVEDSLVPKPVEPETEDIDVESLDEELALPPPPETSAPSRLANFATTMLESDPIELPEKLPLPNGVHDAENENSEVVAEEPKLNGHVEEISLENVQVQMNGLPPDDKSEEETPKTNGFQHDVEQPVNNHQNTPQSDDAEREKNKTETEEAPLIPPPVVPAEPPVVAPPSAPAITEDVTSVTAAIDQMEITDKAVVAAVNEVIKNTCVNNEIIADSVHVNNMNE